MRCVLPDFDRSKPFSSYVCMRKSGFCISFDDSRDFWVSFYSDDYPSYFIGPYSQLQAVKSLYSTLEYFKHLEAINHEK